VSRHTITRREAHPGHREVSGGLARAAVFGMSDGLTSNVLLVIGFAGSGVDSSVVRLAGIAGAIAGAVSMGAGEWISISAQNELVHRELEVERRELGVNTEAEQRELAAMYEDHGMEPDTARRAAADVMRDHERALGVHAREELGVDPARPAVGRGVRCDRCRSSASCSAPSSRSSPGSSWFRQRAPQIGLGGRSGVVAAAVARVDDRAVRRTQPAQGVGASGADHARRVRDHLQHRQGASGGVS
jgi:VIT1/CCC1 family predicted Fe2+/Mn2+ transporter